MLTGHKLEEITETGAAVTAAGGEQRVLDCDTVVMAVGARADRKLARSLAESGLQAEIRCIGDCAGDRPRMLSDAIDEGFHAGLEIRG